MVLFLAFLALGAHADPPRPNEVVVPVKDYLALEERAEAAEKERQRR